MGYERKLAKLYIWPDESLFLSPAAFQNGVFKAVFNKLVVSLDGDFEITLASGKRVQTNSYLVKAGTTLQGGLHANDCQKAIYYFSSVSQDYSLLKSMMEPAYSHISYGHPNGRALRSLLLAIRDEDISPEQSYETLRPLLIPEQQLGNTFYVYDPRVLGVIRYIEDHFMENTSLAQLAEQVHLSSSRLEKLFKEQIGIPITTYRLRYRVFLGIIHLSLGASVTEAALESGFSSLAHFSRSFAAVNGIQPTALFSKPTKISTHIAKEILDQHMKRSNLINRYLGKNSAVGEFKDNYFSTSLERITAS